MNINDVAQREILDFKQFRGKVMDDTYKPFDPQNQKDSYSRTGLHPIKREPAYDFVGYADAIFAPDKAGIGLPGYNAGQSRQYINAIGGPGLAQTPATNESENQEIDEPIILGLRDFRG